MARFIKDLFDKFRENLEVNHTSQKNLEDGKGLDFITFVEMHYGQKIDEMNQEKILIKYKRIYQLFQEIILDDEKLYIQNSLEFYNFYKSYYLHQANRIINTCQEYNKSKNINSNQFFQIYNKWLKKQKTIDESPNLTKKGFIDGIQSFIDKKIDQNQNNQSQNDVEKLIDTIFKKMKLDNFINRYEFIYILAKFPEIRELIEQNLDD